MSTEAAAIEQLQDLALAVHLACRVEMSIKHDALRTPAYRVIARAMNPLHDASFQTAVVRSGFGLGLLKSTG